MTNTQSVFANQPSTQTTGTFGTTTPAASTSESWTMASNTGFPTASAGTTPNTVFYVADPAQPSELIQVTANPSTSWTVTRGSNGTVARHGVGATFYQVVSAADYTNFLQAAGSGQTINPGSLSISQNASAGDVFSVTNTHTTPTAPTVEFFGLTSGDSLLGLAITGDTDFRLTVDTNGKMQWGPGGSTVTDTTLARSSAANLTINPGSLTIQSGLTITSGNITITSGSETITSGNLTVSSGTITVS
jgi:hypothetical protein